MELDVNYRPVSIDCNPVTSLLWVLRDHLNLTDTESGCDVAACGTCTAHADGAAVRSCVLPVAAMAGKHIIIIEGLASGEGECHALQQTWINRQMPQCNYYQSGMLMAAADLPAQHPDPADADIGAAMINICCYGAYLCMRATIKRAARALREGRA